jgi:RNA polymerase sigma-70 factor (ECF subfamily)
MVTVWSKRKELTTNEAGSLENYLFSLLKYGILDTLAYSHKKELRMKVLQQLIVLQESHVLEGLISKELGEAIHHEIAHMPVTMRKVILLSRHHQYSIAEIAGQLSLSEQTVKNLLTKAIKRLRYCIEQHYRDGGTSPQAYLVLLVLADTLQGL